MAMLDGVQEGKKAIWWTVALEDSELFSSTTYYWRGSNIIRTQKKLTGPLDLHMSFVKAHISKPTIKKFCCSCRSHDGQSCPPLSKPKAESRASNGSTPPVSRPLNNAQESLTIFTCTHTQCTYFSEKQARAKRS